MELSLQGSLHEVIVSLKIGNHCHTENSKDFREILKIANVSLALRLIEKNMFSHVYFIFILHFIEIFIGRTKYIGWQWDPYVSNPLTFTEKFPKVWIFKKLKAMVNLTST